MLTTSFTLIELAKSYDLTYVPSFITSAQGDAGLFTKPIDFLLVPDNRAILLIGTI